MKILLYLMFLSWMSALTGLNNSVSEVRRKSTVGSLDMGGGSAQIAFEVGKSVSTYMCMKLEYACVTDRKTSSFTRRQF